MTTEVTAQSIALAYVKGLVPALETHSEAAFQFNRLPNIPWHLREQVRSIEGKLDRVIDDCIDLVSKLGTDEAKDYLETQW